MVKHNTERIAKNTVFLYIRMIIVMCVSLFTSRIILKILGFEDFGIYNVVGSAANAGFINLVYLTAFISLNVGFINFLPIPAFDGGRILFLLIEKIKGSPVDPRFENTIHSIGFFLLMALMILITYNDILRLIG